jgi:hypothetical protein
MKSIKIGQFTLAGNARTVVVYRNLYGRELLSDLVKYNQQTLDAFQKLRELQVVRDFEDLELDKFEQLDTEQKVAYTQAVEKYLRDVANKQDGYYEISMITVSRQNFLMDVFVACVIAANYKNPPNKDDIIDNLDLQWFCQGREFEELQIFFNNIYPSGKVPQSDGGTTKAEPNGSAHTTTTQAVSNPTMTVIQ